MSRRAALSINFAGRNYRLLSRISGGLAVGAGALACLALILLWSALSSRAGCAVMDRKLADLAAQEERVRPLLEERERLVRDLGAMSALLEARRFSWTRLFSKIESVVPTGVALGSVKFNPRDRSLSLDGAAQSPEALRTLVVGLEQSTSFRDPFLKRQSVDKGRISFNVVAVYLDGENPGAAR